MERDDSLIDRFVHAIKGLNKKSDKNAYAENVED